MSPVLSVVIPCFNGAHWLANSLGSVLAEQAPDFEVIVVDDGSEDDSRVVLKEFASRDSRVQIIFFRNNKGIVDALNAGLDAARGLYVARMDVDDICLPGRFLRQVEYLEEMDLDLCGSWFVEFGQGLPRGVRWATSEAAVRAAMIFQNSICHPTVMARRAVFDAYRYRRAYQWCEDYDLFIRASKDFRIGNVPELLLRYRRHRQQVTASRRAAMEDTNRQIRVAALQASGIPASPEEQRLHHLVRGPASILDEGDLAGVELWLRKLILHFDHPEAHRVVATQWLRACIRAAPMGRQMWRRFEESPLCGAADLSPQVRADLYLLSLLKLDYSTALFRTLRRCALST